MNSPMLKVLLVFTLTWTPVSATCWSAGCWMGMGSAMHRFNDNGSCEYNSCVVFSRDDYDACGPCPDRIEPASTSVVTVYNEGEVILNGLWLTKKVFGHMITAIGTSSIVVHRDYIFVTHYTGGMDQRFVGISRKHRDRAGWTTIVFPHQHCLYRKDKDLPEAERRGDSHNNIALGISPVDDTMHLLYDMHAYTPEDFPQDYFNYQRSVAGAALVNDEDFTLDLFYPKQTYLNPNSPERDYYRVTYPSFFVVPSTGNLMVSWRVGGSTNAEIKLSEYQNGSWSAPRDWNTRQYIGIYGEFRIYNTALYFGWQRRSSVDTSEGFVNNRGLFLARASTENGTGNWTKTSGTPSYGLPLNHVEVFQEADPSKPGESMIGGGGGAVLPFLVTPSGDFHVHVRVDGAERHCFRKSVDTKFQIVPSDEKWSSPVSLFYLQDRVYRVGLQQDRPVVQSTEPGSDNWHDEYRQTTGRIYTHGVTTQDGDSIYYYLMQRKPRETDERPLYVLRFTVEAT